MNALEAITRTADATGAAVKKPLDYYDANRKEYLVRNSEDVWLQFTETQYKRILRGRGLSGTLSKDDPVSEQDRAILEAQDKRALVYSGLLAGWSAGVQEIPAGRLLITRGPLLIEPASGEWSNVRLFLGSLLAADAVQIPVAYGWLKVAIEALRAGNFRPGQVLAIAGPRNCGKSLFQKLITVLFGNRFSRPYAFMAGRTEFNKDLFEAEHLIVEDDVPSTRLEDRRNFGAKIKEITANEGQRLHAKHRDALLLPVFWRLSVSVNDEPENLMILPPMDESLADKITLLKAGPAVLPCETETAEGRARCWRTLTAELPALVAHLLAWQIPDALRSQRYGVREFHHPDILRTLAELSPESKLAELIDAELFSGLNVCVWTGSATELERRLTTSNQIGYDARRLLPYNTACGVYLSRLALKYPDRYRRTKHTTANVWTIQPPLMEGLEGARAF